jgi:hypothetical protein
MSTGVDLGTALAACAGGMVAAQEELDTLARAAFVRFDDTGVPPVVYHLSNIDIELPMGARLAASEDGGERVGTIAWRPGGAGRAALRLVHRPAPPDEVAEVGS